MAKLTGIVRDLLALSLLHALGGCASDPIRERVRQHRYFEADELCREGARAGNRVCEEARLGALATHVANLQRLRHGGQSASQLGYLAELDQTLALAGERPLAPGSTITQALADEVAQATQALSAGAKSLAEKPLTTEVYWEKRIPILKHGPLRQLVVTKVEQIPRAGQEACGRLTKARDNPDSPYHTALIRRYCTHFGTVDERATVDRGQVTVAFQTKDVPTEEQQTIRQQVVRAIGQTPWSKAPMSPSIHVTVEGTYQSAQTDQTVVLHGQYTEHHLAYPLGKGAPVVVPQTVDYPYEARDHWRRYEANLRITVDLPNGAKPFALTFKKGESLRGRDHHGAQAIGVAPVHTTIPTAGGWLAMEFGAFATDLTAALDGHFVTSFCKAASYSVENAARCLLANQTSEPVLKAIADSLGEDRDAIVRLAAEWPARR